MAILRAYVLYDQDLDEIYGLQIVPVFLVVIAITIASFFLNATFAFAIMRPGAPIRPAFAEARTHMRQIAGFGVVVGFLLGIATTVAPRWGSPWFSIFLGGVIGLMMVAYIAVPARIIGAKPTYSRRERMVTTVVSGVLGVTVSLPPYLIGRLGFLMLGSKVLLIPGIILVAIGITLEAGATGAVRAIKLSAGLQQRSRPGSRRCTVRAMSGERDPRVDDYIGKAPEWQQEICQRVRELVLGADPEVEETIKRTIQPYYVLHGNICALQTTKNHVNVFLYCGGIVPDPRRDRHRRARRLDRAPDQDPPGRADQREGPRRDVPADHRQQPRGRLAEDQGRARTRLRATAPGSSGLSLASPSTPRARSIALEPRFDLLEVRGRRGLLVQVAALARLLDQRRGHRGRDDGDEPDALEHQDRADDPAFGVGGHDVAVTNRRHGLERPPHAHSQIRELVVVDDPDQRPLRPA